MPVTKPRSWSSTVVLLDRADLMNQIRVLDANLSHVQRDATEIKNDQRRSAYIPHIADMIWREFPLAV